MANQENVAAQPRYHAFDPYYRANAKGNGSAVKFELHPAHGDVQGSIFVTLAPQKTVGQLQGGTRIFPTFDWKEAIFLKLDRSDLSQILQVLRGMQETVNGEKGLFHQGMNGHAIIRFSHQIDPRPGYMLSVKKAYAGGQQRKGYYFFDMSEAFTLMLALERAMLYVCFGIPEVIVRSPVQNAAPQPVAAPLPAPTHAGTGLPPFDVEEPTPDDYAAASAF